MSCCFRPDCITRSSSSPALLRRGAAPNAARRLSQDLNLRKTCVNWHLAPRGYGRIYQEVTGTTWGWRYSTYIGFFERGAFAMARTTEFQSGAGTLAGHYRISHHLCVYTNSAAMTELEDAFRATLDDITSL